MTKTIAAILLLLTACTDTPATDVEIHEVVECDANWDGNFGLSAYASCEAPCANRVKLGSNRCTHSGDEICDSIMSSIWMGRVGCCLIDRDPTAEVTVTFAVCDIDGGE